ncbi:MAG: outer membrane lipoprotein-sorting protein [Deltaproteobacteria bacterium]|nr:outer membrane lipoprotein-sorting protein [Deltaproteobacteria bacterium]MBI3388758.1 outer membrane lipoprotein-sorting protein [Deltaproteobacteria bacterium]
MLRRLRLPVVPVAVLGVLVLFAPGRAGADQARDLVKAALDALPRVPFVATLKVSVDRGAPREVRLSSKVIDGTRASYLEVVAPIDLQGMRFLFLEHPDARSEQFLRIANVRRVIQIADEVRKHSFLGSSFYVADLVEPQLQAFTYTVVGHDDVGRRHCTLIESVPKAPASALYAKTVLAIDPTDSLVLKRLFLDEKGTLLKVWTVEKVEKVDGYWTLRDQRMKDLVEHTESRLEVTDVKYNVELPDAMFAPEYLAR